jgi:hypothetical protein
MNTRLSPGLRGSFSPVEAKLQLKKAAHAADGLVEIDNWQAAWIMPGEMKRVSRTG